MLRNPVFVIDAAAVHTGFGAHFVGGDSQIGRRHGAADIPDHG
jgi:hypothetical protein